MENNAADGGQFNAALFVTCEPFNAISVPAGRPLVALHNPLKPSEMTHATKIFDKLFAEFEPALPLELVSELDAFECEFDTKYDLKMAS
jgi:hypothetical protein